MAAVADDRVCEPGAMLIRDVVPAADTELARALLRIQRAAYAVEAAVIQDDRIPPLHENLDDLQHARLRWLIAVFDGQVCGAVAWTEDADEVDLDRLIVAPGAHRRGVGLALVGTVLRRAAARRTTVSTARANGPARALYERLGFSAVHDREFLPGLWITRYLHIPKENAPADGGNG
ncbi:MAG: GNAT family N-acetyltransferase [Pseudonocardiaceae bacterium]